LKRLRKAELDGLRSTASKEQEGKGSEKSPGAFQNKVPDKGKWGHGLKWKEGSG